MSQSPKKRGRGKEYGTWMVKDFNPPAITFNEKYCGVRERRNLNITSPFEAVKLIWPAEVWQQIVDCTNDRGGLKSPGWGADDIVEQPDDQYDIENDTEEEAASRYSDTDDNVSDEVDSESEEECEVPNSSWRPLTVQ